MDYNNGITLIMRKAIMTKGSTAELVLGGGSVWGVIKITSWADLSYALAAIYTACLLGHWLWRNIIKPLRIRHAQRKAETLDRVAACTKHVDD